ncbi:MAG TPA: hypothetical protein VKA48_12770, partial [Gammaproteobacteria bacterium]|nr:hypothetical protein [Gammaproteobacteria bacterium]
MPIGSLVNGLAQGYQAGQQAMDQHRVAQLREEKLRRELEQQQAMEDAAAQAQEAATTQPAGYSGQQAMEGTTTVSAPHAYSGQGTDMSIANVYDQGPAMEGGLRDQVTTQQPGGFALPTQTEQGLKDPQKFDYREYLSNLGQEVAKRDPQQAAEIHDTLNSLADEGFQEFAKSLMLGDTDRAEQEYNLTGQGRIKPGSLKVDYDQGTVSLVDQDGEQQTMDLDTVFALGGV